MPPRRKRPTHTAVIWWDDAHFISGEVDPHHDAGAYTKMSSGFLIQDNDKGYRVAQDWNHEAGTYEAVTFVPRAMVTKIRRFKVPTERKAKR